MACLTWQNNIIAPTFCPLLRSPTTPSPSGSSSYIRSDAQQCSTMLKRLVQQLEKAKEEHARKVTAQEIECPSCHDVMTLHSEFDRLGYFCEECYFSLYLCH
jgi:hypothetical protein